MLTPLCQPTTLMFERPTQLSKSGESPAKPVRKIGLGMCHLAVPNFWRASTCPCGRRPAMHALSPPPFQGEIHNLGTPNQLRAAVLMPPQCGMMGHLELRFRLLFFDEPVFDASLGGECLLPLGLPLRRRAVAEGRGQRANLGCGRERARAYSVAEAKQKPCSMMG